MKKCKIKLINIVTQMITQFALVVLSTQAFASWWNPSIDKPFPTDPADLAGVYTGKQTVGGEARSVEVMIHKVPMAGSFIVTILTERKRAQLFYAELIEEKTAGLITLGLNEEMSSPAQVRPPAALMKILVNRKNIIESIEISPQDGAQNIEGPVVLNETSSDLEVSDVLVEGKYVGSDRSDILQVYKSKDDILVSGKVDDLGISNDYSLSFDLTGVGALRAKSFGDYYQTHEKSEVSALILPLKFGRTPSFIVVKASRNGSPAKAMLMVDP